MWMAELLCIRDLGSSRNELVKYKDSRIQG